VLLTLFIADTEITVILYLISDMYSIFSVLNLLTVSGDFYETDS